MKQTLKTYLFFFIVLIILYYPTRHAGFVTDFLGWQMAYDDHSFWQILQGKDHNIKSFYHFTHLLMYGMSALFGKGSGWYWVQCGLVASNAVLIFILFKKMSEIWGLQKGHIVAWIGIAFWLVSPYLSEVMVWRAAFHYPLAFSIHITYLLGALKYIETGNSKYIYASNILFFISLFSLEYFFVTPFLIFATVLLLSLGAKEPFLEKIKTYKNALLTFCLIPLVGILLYLSAFYAHYGKWVSHSRQADAPFLFANLESYGTYINYIGKYLFFLRHLGEAEKVKVFGFMYEQNHALIAAFIILIISVLGLYFLKKMSAWVKMLYWCFAFYSLWIVPVVSLFFAKLLLTENDRYGYTPSVFLMLSLALILSKLPKILFYSISVLYISVSLYFTIQTNQYWKQSGEVYSGLIDNYKWQDTENVVLLNIPDCLNGMYMFRRYDYTSAFSEAYKIFKHKELPKSTQEAMRYNMTSGKDGVYVVMDAPDTLRVVIGQFGTWWMMSNWGVDDYEREDYKIKIGNGDYKLILKPTVKKHTFLYHVGTEWKTVDTSLLHIAQR